MKIYTRKGDDGTTGLLYGGRVRKDSARPTAYGTVDEAQAALGVARAQCVRGGELDEVLVALERDLWVLMAEMATAPGNRHKLTGGTNLVTADMVVALEAQIDAFTDRYEQPTEFVVPGQDPLAAQLDVARTVVRRAERDALAVDDEDHGDEPSQVTPYLNRLSDLVWTLARWQEANAGEGSLPSRGA
jgi:cob(I)alamin adenosyltransferase